MSGLGRCALLRRGKHTAPTVRPSAAAWRRPCSVAFAVASAGFLFNVPIPTLTLRLGSTSSRSAPCLSRDVPVPRSSNAEKPCRWKNNPSARLSLPRTPLGTVTNAARLSSPASKPKRLPLRRPPPRSSTPGRLSAPCAPCSGGVPAGKDELVEQADGCTRAAARQRPCKVGQPSVSRDAELNELEPQRCHTPAI